MGTDDAFKVFIVPDFFVKEGHFLQHIISKSVSQEHMPPQCRNNINNVQNRVGKISVSEVIHAHNPRQILLAINVILGLQFVELFEVFWVVQRPQIKFNIVEGMAVDFVVVGEAVDLASCQADEQVVTVLDAVLVGGGFRALAVEVPAADEAAVHVVVGERYAAHFLEVKVEQVPADCAQVWACARAGLRLLLRGHVI